MYYCILLLYFWLMEKINEWMNESSSVWLFLICRPFPFSLARFCDTRMSSFIWAIVMWTLRPMICPHKFEEKMYGLKLEHLRLETGGKVFENLVSSIVYRLSSRIHRLGFSSCRCFARLQRELPETINLFKAVFIAAMSIKQEFCIHLKVSYC